MLSHLTLVVGLLTPDPAAAYVCDRLVAAGALSAARGPCQAAGQGGGLDPLDRAQRAARTAAGARDKARVAALLEALEAAEGARREAPERVVEEALVAHLARAVRAGVAPAETPAAARWPLPGLPLPQPSLPPLNDPPFDEAAERLRRADERLSAVRMQVAEGAPPTLGVALEKMERERSMLVQSRLAALSDALQRDSKLPPTWWLDLAGAYFDADEDKPTIDARRERGLHVLNKLRSTHPNDGAAGVAGLWLAGFAYEAGNFAQVRRLLDEAGPFDPALTALYEALLAWHEGRLAEVREKLAMVRDQGTPSVRIQIAALLGDVAEDPREAARAWEQVASLTASPSVRQRARLRVAVAWGEALAAGAPPDKVPQRALRPTLLHLHARGRLPEADALYDVIGTVDPVAADLPELGLQLVEAWRAAGDDAAADRRLVALIKALTPADGAFAKAHPAQAAPLRARLLAQLEARLAPAIAAGVPLDAEERRQLTPLVDARLQDLPPAEEARFGLARSLAVLGFDQRARLLLKRVREEAPTPAARLDAARVLVDLELARARLAGEAGAPVGPWLHGAPARPPMPVEVRALLDAQTALIERLLPEAEERDRLLVDRATLRIAFGDADAVLGELRDVAERRLREPLGLRAIHQLLQAPPGNAEAEALRWSRRQPGPPTHEPGLRRTLSAAYAGRAADQAMALVNQHLHARAAQLYEHTASTAEGGAARDARVAAAVCWTLALHPTRAMPAWQKVIEQHAGEKLEAEARRHLADLLEARGDRVAAAEALAALADRFPEEGAEALLRALALRAHDRAASGRLMQTLVERHPDHPEASTLRARLAALNAIQSGPARPAGAPPAPPAAPCAGQACITQPFWP